VYTTGEPARDQRGLTLLPDPPRLLWPPLLLDAEKGRLQFFGKNGNCSAIEKWV
jgi:hypothetical protein